MAVTSTKAAASASNVAGIGTVAWTSASNVTSSDDSQAQGVLSAGAITQWLRIYFTFTSSDVPSGATIDGVEITIEAQHLLTLNGQLKDNAMRLVLSGTIQGSNVSNMPTTAWNTADADVTTTYGGASNLWGASPTQADVVSGSFGCAFSVKNTEASKSRNALVDYATCKVYYTVAASYDPSTGTFDHVSTLQESVHTVLCKANKIEIQPY